jgi:hypothetical protein
MRVALDPFSFLITTLAGWMNQHQRHVIEYLMEENRVLREQIGDRRLRFSNDQRRRLAAKAKKIGSAFWRALNETAGTIFHYPATQVARTASGLSALTVNALYVPQPFQRMVRIELSCAMGRRGSIGPSPGTNNSHPLRKVGASHRLRCLGLSAHIGNLPRRRIVSSRKCTRHRHGARRFRNPAAGNSCLLGVGSHSRSRSYYCKKIELTSRQE